MADMDGAERAGSDLNGRRRSLIDREEEYAARGLARQHTPLPNVWQSQGGRGVSEEKVSGKEHEEAQPRLQHLPADEAGSNAAVLPAGSPGRASQPPRGSKVRA